METTLTHTQRPSPSLSEGRPSALRDWAALFVCLLALLGFVFVLAPEFRRIEAVDTMANYVDESGIDATALYYTEVEATGDAENYLRSALATPP